MNWPAVAHARPVQPGSDLYDGFETPYIGGMDFLASLSVDEELRLQVQQRAQKSGPRVERIEVGGRFFWIKRVEQLGLRYRLQKGDPRKAFERERLAYQDMNAAGAPVPLMVADGADFLVLPDCGADLRHRFGHERDPAQRQYLLLKAVECLIAFHGAGFAHGRPSPKDMCLVHDQVLLLDFERYMPSHNTPKGQARDLVVFAHNVAAHSPAARDGLRDAMAVYRESASAEVWPLAQQWCRRMRWADWVTKPIQMRPGKGSKEFKAIPIVMDLFLND